MGRGELGFGGSIEDSRHKKKYGREFVGKIPYAS